MVTSRFSRSTSDHCILSASEGLKAQEAIQTHASMAAASRVSLAHLRASRSAAIANGASVRLMRA